MDLRTSWNAISGGGDPLYFGPERESARIQARAAELDRLRQEPLIEIPHASPTFTGGEHDVWVTGDPASKVFKRTLQGAYGYILDEKILLDPRTFLNRRRLALRPALPSEYLLRWTILRGIFSLPTDYLGRACNGSEPSMAVSQPYVDQDENDQPDADDVEEFMIANHFEKVDAGIIENPENRNCTWYRQRDGILITDAFPRNFRKHKSEHALVPIDLVVTLMPAQGSILLAAPETPWLLIPTATL